MEDKKNIKVKNSNQYKKLRQMLINDTLKMPESVYNVIKSAITDVLNDYFVLDKVNVNIDVCEHDCFEIKLVATAKSVRNVKTVF